MIALAILAVGAVCVMSTFAAAIALHMRREDDIRSARVLEEARQEAQQAWDAWRPSGKQALPPPLENIAWGRDPNVAYSISFEAVPGQPLGLDGSPAGVNALVRVIREGQEARPRAREMRIFVVRSGFRAEDMKGSYTFDREKEQQKMKSQDPSSRPKDR
jgi:hypothetical protein